jgi:hypothetical protein
MSIMVGNLENILTFEDFIAPAFGIPVPIYNNFPLHFQDSEENDYRKTEYFIRFNDENLELTQSLTQRITQLKETKNFNVRSLTKINPDLYQAYIIMRGYGVTNKDLFA